MKKKITLAFLAIVCALCCALALAACGGGDTPKLESLKIEKVGGQLADSDTFIETEITYGEKPDLNFYKLYLKYSNGDTKEIATNDDKLTVKYYYKAFRSENERQVIDKLPTEWVSGIYTIEYTYDEISDSYNKKAEANIIVDWAKSGAFTVNSTKTTWYEGENLPTVTLKTPKGLAVEKVTNIYEVSEKNDTKGIFDLRCMQKTAYDALTEEQKTDLEYLDTLGDSSIPYSSDGYLAVGEYMLFAMVRETYNYNKIVTSAVKLTVKDAVKERTFTFKNIVLQDSEGNAVTDTQLVAEAEELKTKNQGKTIIFKENGEVRGTVELDDGKFDDMPTDTVYHYIKHSYSEVVIGTPDGDGILQIAECTLTGNTLTVKMAIRRNESKYYWIITFIGE